MTEIEYMNKRQNLATSSAPIELIDEAIAKLDESYLISSSSIDKAKQQIEDSKPDTSDIGDH